MPNSRHYYRIQKKRITYLPSTSRRAASQRSLNSRESTSSYIHTQWIRVARDDDNGSARESRTNWRIMLMRSIVAAIYEGITSAEIVTRVIRCLCVCVVGIYMCAFILYCSGYYILRRNGERPSRIFLLVTRERERESEKSRRRAGMCVHAYIHYALGLFCTFDILLFFSWLSDFPGCFSLANRELGFGFVVDTSL